MAILKIKEVGDEATVTISAVELVPSTDPKMGNQIKFDTTEGDTIYVSEGAVERQLVRIGVESIDKIPGQTIRFSRAANKNPAFPPYWNIDRTSAGQKQAQQKLLPNENGDEDYLDEYLDQQRAGHHQETGAPPAAQAVSQFAVLVKKYKECVAAANDAWGDDTSDEALVAACATLFIQRCQQKI